jgi:predicted HTH transcriptional regulator
MSSERLGVSHVELEELDLAALDRYLAERAPALVAAGGREEAGLRLGLLAKTAPRVVPSLVGLYVFGKLPQYAFPEWGVSCVGIAGRSLGEPIERRVDLEGPLPVLAEAALGFVCGVGDEREADGGPYPREVVREAIVNALVHRDLRKPSRVAVRVYTDRLEIWSPGGPPEGQTDLEELAREGGVSVPRNPLLASIARRLGLGEQLGRGLVLVMQRGAPSLEERVEIKTSPREVLVSVPPRWKRPATAAELS